MEWLIEPLYWNWIILAAVFFLLEIASISFFFMFWGVAALIMAAIAALFPDLNIFYQLMIFSIFILIAVVVWWKWVARPWQKNELDSASRLNNLGKNLIGEIYDLSHPIINGRARVQINDSLWMIKCQEDLEKGIKIKIIDIDGMTLIVERAS